MTTTGRFTVDDITNRAYYMVPKRLWRPPYEKLSLQARVLYAVMLDHAQLSIRNGWTTPEGDVYVILTHETAGDILGIKSRTTTVKVFEELVRAGLCDREWQPGINKPNLYFPHHPAEEMPLTADGTQVAAEAVAEPEETEIERLQREIKARAEAVKARVLALSWVESAEYEINRHNAFTRTDDNGREVEVWQVAVFDIRVTDGLTYREWTEMMHNGDADEDSEACVERAVQVLIAGHKETRMYAAINYAVDMRLAGGELRDYIRDEAERWELSSHDTSYMQYQIPRRIKEAERAEREEAKKAARVEKARETRARNKAAREAQQRAVDEEALWNGTALAEGADAEADAWAERHGEDPVDGDSPEEILGLDDDTPGADWYTATRPGYSRREDAWMEDPDVWGEQF